MVNFSGLKKNKTVNIKNVKCCLCLISFHLVKVCLCYNGIFQKKWSVHRLCNLCACERIKGEEEEGKEEEDGVHR